MTTQRVWPGLNSSGVSLVVYAEDGVTLIPAAGGADVTLIQEQDGGPFVLPAYYRNKVAISVLLTYDPLGLSGDAVVVPPVTRVSGSLASILTVSLSTRIIISADEVVSTSGYSSAGDGGADMFTGELGGGDADGLWRIAAPNGVWVRTQSIRNSTINVNKFGILPGTGADYSAVFQTLVSLEVPTQVYGSNRQVTWYFPTGRYTIKNIKPRTGFDNRVQVLGDGWFGGNAPYGDSLWEDEERVGGTVLYGDGSDVFQLENNGPPLSTDSYRFLRLVDLSVVTHGSGRGVWMEATNGDTDAAAGGFEAFNVMIGGAALGIQFQSYTGVRCQNLTVWGCDVGVRFGKAGFGFVMPATFHWLEVQRCNIGVDWAAANDVSIFGGLIQSNTVHHNFAAGSGNGNNTVMSVYHEAGTFISCHATANPGAMLFQKCGVGNDPAVLLYGNGWTFIGCQLNTVHFGGLVFGVKFLACAVTIGNTVPGSDIQVDNVFRTQGSHPFPLGASVSGTVAVDGYNQGSLQTMTVVGATVLQLPDYAPRGCRITFVVTQGGAGGYAISATGTNVHGTISNTGNTVGRKCAITFLNDDKNTTDWLLESQTAWLP